MAQTIREVAPDTTLILGGGWVNDRASRGSGYPRVFDYFDYVTLDDGERPLLNLLSRLSGRPTTLVRTYVRKDREVVLEERSDTT